MAVARQKDKRTNLIQLIHIGCSKVGLTGESAQAFKEDHTGKSSCSEMTLAELESVLAALKNAGFVVANRSGKKRMPVTERDRGYASEEQLEYIKGLWELAARIKTDAALESFVRRLIHVDALRFMAESDATKVILALRSMATKAGYDPDNAIGRYQDGR
jgi:Mu-like prophage protein gp16